MDMHRESAIQALTNYIEYMQKEERINRPFDVYKEDLAYNLIGNDNNMAKAVLRLTVLDLEVGIKDSFFTYLCQVKNP